MNKNLLVLAECVDSRNGKRYTKGDEFNPPPTVEQAQRLVAARCLPEGALTEAKKFDDAGAKKAEAEAKAKAAADAKGQELVVAQTALTSAISATVAAQAEFDEAPADQKTDKAKVLTAAQKAEAEARAAVAKVAK